MQKRPVPIGFVTLAHLEHPFFTILTRAARPSEQVNTSNTPFLQIPRTLGCSGLALDPRPSAFDSGCAGPRPSTFDFRPSPLAFHARSGVPRWHSTLDPRRSTSPDSGIRPSTLGVDVPSTSQFLNLNRKPVQAVRDNPGLYGIIRDNGPPIIVPPTPHLENFKVIQSNSNLFKVKNDRSGVPRWHSTLDLSAFDSGCAGPRSSAFDSPDSGIRPSTLDPRRLTAFSL